jgi:hypothetical protein
MGITSAGLFLLFFLETNTSIPFIVSSLCILGFGFALFSSPNTNAIMSSVESRLYGVASSMLATMRLLGQMFSMGIAMMIFATYLGRAEITTCVLSLSSKVRQGCPFCALACSVLSAFCFTDKREM